VRRLAVLAALLLVGCQPEYVLSADAGTRLVADSALSARFDSAYRARIGLTTFPWHGRIAVTTASSWSAVWDGDPRPAVDFANYMVVFASMGEQGGGRWITIDDVREVDGRVRVFVTEHYVGGCPVGTGVVTPTAARLVPKRAMTVEFIEQQKREPC
jgi:hypothetical protein